MIRHNKAVQDKQSTSWQMPGRVPFRAGPISFLWRPRVVLVCLIATALIVFLGALSIGLGDYPISVPRVLQVIFHGEGSRVENSWSSSGACLE